MVCESPALAKAGAAAVSPSLQVLAKAEPAVIKKIFDNEPSRCSGKAAA